MNLEAKIEYWKKSLLNLGKRNKMINCPEPKIGKRISRASLKIEYPQINDLWDIIVKREEYINFPVDINTDEEIDEENQNDPKINDIFSNGYKTNQSVIETCKTLIALKNKARLFIENKGVNALYLAFGFLNWKDNGMTGQQMRSPLILVPVTITQKSIAEPIFITKTDKEIIGNTSLKQKLYNDFNLDIPMYNEDDDLHSYLKTIEEECESLGWTVDYDSVQLMMLSYLKMAMYQDIVNHEDEIKDNPIIRMLNGETNHFDYDSIPQVGTINHDLEDPATVYSVVDADSSQQDAITLAKSGVSFVLQGPPGTGKSQTITNIIAELLGQGKKVLFVSEKMAALEVVYKRLAAAGLADFCLTLHNPDAKRKDIIDQLAVSIDLSENKAEVEKEAFNKLESLKISRESLNEYDSQLHTKVSPLGETIFRVNGYISKLEAYPDMDFVENNARYMTSEDLAMNKDALSEFERVVFKSGYQKNTPWLGCTVEDVSHLFRQKFSVNSEKLIAYLNEGIEIFVDSCTLISNGNVKSNYQSCKAFEKILEIALQSPRVPYCWFEIDISLVKEDLSLTKTKIENKKNIEALSEKIKQILNSIYFCCSKMFEYIMEDNDSDLNTMTGQFNAKYTELVALLSQENECIVSNSKSNIILCIQQYEGTLNKLRFAVNDKIQKEERIKELTDEETHEKTVLDECQKASDLASSLVVSYEEKIKELTDEEARQKVVLDECRKTSDFANSLVVSYEEKIKELTDEEVRQKVVLDECRKTSDSANSLVVSYEEKIKELTDEEIRQKAVLDECQKASYLAKELVTAEYREEILDIDIPTLRARFDKDYSSSFRLFNSEYRKDCKMIKSYSIKKAQAKYKEILELLKVIEDAQQKKAILDEQAETVKKLSLELENCRSDLLKSTEDAGQKKIDLDKQAETVQKLSLELEDCKSEMLKSTENAQQKKSILDEQTDKVQKLSSELEDCKSEMLKSTEDAQQKKSVLDEQNDKVQKLSSELENTKNELTDINNEILSLSQKLPEAKEKYKTKYNTFTKKCKKMLQTYEKELNQEADVLSEKFSDLFNTIGLELTENSNIESIINKFDWLEAFLGASKSVNVSDEFMRLTAEADEKHMSNVKSIFEKISSWIEGYSRETDYFFSLFDEEHQEQFIELPIEELLNKVKNCHDNMSKLEEYIDYKNAISVIEKQGLTQYLEIISDLELESCKIVPSYEKCFYRSWLDAVLPDFEQIKLFRHDKQEKKIEDFKQLDENHIQISRMMLKSLLIKQLPNLNFAGIGDESAILKHELNKKRRFMPIRKLIAALPSLLPALKPCMMMSPLSVSTYFGSSDFIFDAVIFDEASQLRTEDSIGSIFRAKQVVIAGDSKQLPPTDFFNTSLLDSTETDENDEEVNDAGAYESLLDEASFLPTQTLLWHYRSKHESLIAFSNYKIYKKGLITFPSSIKQEKDIGVEYIYVEDGIYDRGGTGGNRKEAERIVELLIEHFTKHPDRSVGIIAFGEKQQNIIENEVIKLRQTHPEFEQYFKDNTNESLFIRNLESVQGDERDTIIFSIGYGYDPSGKFAMNFGPLSRDGGERRLNVAITRARYNLKLVGSILPTDIKTDRISSIGPKLLREYIDFAINGEKVLKAELDVSDDLCFDSPFEESVYNFLVSQGYRVATQVGCSGYRIDMAVYHPNYDGRFVIGIECDGASYHSARTARERDRLRQSVLEGMGWKIYRIWSTDWIKDTLLAKKELNEAIQKSIKNYIKPEPQIVSANKSDISYLKITEKEVISEQKKYRSGYVGFRPQDIPKNDFKKTILKILKDGCERRQIDNLIRDAANLGYDWHRVGKNIREKFIIVLSELKKEGKIDIVDDEVRLL